MGFNGIGHFADLFSPSAATVAEQLFQHQQQQQQQLHHQQQQQQQPFQMHHQQQHYEECCVPTGDCVMRSLPIRPDDPRAADLYARVVCSDGGCSVGRYMHRECFVNWERLVLAYMKNAAANYANTGGNTAAGRRIKDLWTVNVNNNNVVNLNQKGYEMAFKACGCRCGMGYLKKDSEWPPATVRRQSSGSADDAGRTAAAAGKKKKRRQQKAAAAPPLYVPAVDYAGELRLRAGSLSGSSNGSSSPVTGGTSCSSDSPAHSGSFGSGTSTTGTAGSGSSSSKRRSGGACFKDVFER